MEIAENYRERTENLSWTLEDTKKYLGELFSTTPLLVRSAFANCPRSGHYNENDLSQDTYLVAAADAESFTLREGQDPREGIRSWAYGIARNRVKAFTYKQSQERRKKEFKMEEALEQEAVEIDVPAIYQELFKLEFQGIMRGMLNRMSDRDLFLLRGFYHHGRPIRDLSEELGRDESTVRKSLGNAEDRLERLLFRLDYDAIPEDLTTTYFF